MYKPTGHWLARGAFGWGAMMGGGIETTGVWWEMLVGLGVEQNTPRASQSAEIIMVMAGMGSDFRMAMFLYGRGEKRGRGEEGCRSRHGMTNQVCSFGFTSDG